jgi:hypothetical protein
MNHTRGRSLTRTGTGGTSNGGRDPYIGKESLFVKSL